MSPRFDYTSMGFIKRFGATIADAQGVATISNDPVDPLPAAVSTEWLTELSPEVIETLCATTLPAAK